LLLKIIDLWGKTINLKTSSREEKKRLIIHNISKGNKKGVSLKNSITQKCFGCSGTRA
jgi:hypothetical protein